ncbi:hypothetical protein TSOC_010895 [Tetrabaena socialis]|uniref:SAP domain-containing protein n=1 Tax=Tetrabaena socialis TaxID=47790 RepID=A0A2J7ZS25_9CHLO|nr:hypothetical protein TSOC_010895 [Tetrabaena socialis]|eukprot:PNH03074.1 hypothetical protein TSOC_010895 [Tetrabaena socialis]
MRHIHPRSPYGTFTHEVWALISTHLAGTLDPPGGLRGPDAVARDIVRAGLACRDMWHASREGLEKLAAVVPILPSDQPWGPPQPLLLPSSDWPAWDALLRQPATHELVDLQQAATDLKLHLTGTKPELVLRLLGHFELHAPCPMPVRLWVALKQERACGAFALSEGVRAQLSDLRKAGNAASARHLDNRFVSLAAARRELCAAFESTAGLLMAHQACLELLTAQQRAWKRIKRRLKQEGKRTQEERQRRGISRSKLV